jgi:hypothetical protein
MRLFCFIFTSLFPFALLPNPAFAGEPKPVKIMIVGTFHMHNPGLDVFNLEADNMLTPKRQAEIQTLTDKLARFKPKRIAVEQVGIAEGESKSNGFLANYPAYREGKFELRSNEIHQIGFRLAHQLGHQRLYPVDASYDFPFATLEAQAKALGQGHFLEAANAWGDTLTKREQELLLKSSVGEFMRSMNHPAYLLGIHRLYLDYFVPIGDGTQFPGADLVRDWYARNLRIFHNLVALRYQGEGPILLLIGAGHAHILKQLVNDSGLFELVDPLEYM